MNYRPGCQPTALNVADENPALAVLLSFRRRAGVAFDGRFADFGTSGLEFEVTSGDNHYLITVTRPGTGHR
jgi:hypothetical protein